MTSLELKTVIFYTCQTNSHVVNDVIGKPLGTGDYDFKLKIEQNDQFFLSYTTDMNMGVVLLGYRCSCITTDLGSHRGQTSYLCTYLYLLLYAYGAYMINISTSLYLCLGNHNT